MLVCKAGLHVRRKHKHKPRVNWDDASRHKRKEKERALVLVSSRFTRVLCLCSCCACVVRVNQPWSVWLHPQRRTSIFSLTKITLNSWLLGSVEKQEARFGLSSIRLYTRQSAVMHRSETSATRSPRSRDLAFLVDRVMVWLIRTKEGVAYKGTGIQGSSVMSSPRRSRFLCFPPILSTFLLLCTCSIFVCVCVCVAFVHIAASYTEVWPFS